jgi:tetratricopeptide (TPR) repeat protein
MRYPFKHRQHIFHLISKYESMLEKGRVAFPEEQPYLELIDYFEGECLLERALEIADHAILQYNLSARLYLRKAELQLENREAALALATLDKAERLAPGSLAVPLLRAEGYASLDMCEDAIAMLDSLKPAADAKALSDILLCEAMIYEQLKDYNRMYYVLKSALEENPTNSEALSRMWYCVEYVRKYEESIELHERILDVDPFCALAWYNLGAAHHYLCNYDEAIESYEYAFLVKEDFEFAYRDCAEVCLYIKDYAKALQCYQEILERFEPDAELFLHIASCYFETGKYTLAKTFYERATHHDSWCAPAFYGIGQCLAKQKDWRPAIEVLRKATTIEEENEEYQVALAEAYMAVGNHKKAEFHFALATELAPELAEIWLRRAGHLLNTGRAEASMNLLNDEAELESYDSKYLYFRVCCLFEMGNRQEALFALEEALIEDYHSHPYLFTVRPHLEDDRDVRALIAAMKPEMGQ